MKELVCKLEETHNLTRKEWITLITNAQYVDKEDLAERARRIQHQYFGDQVYTRGLIEFTNYCKNDCYYCGIRRSNTKAQRYRLTEEEILACAREGHDLGFRTFVLQGGEDGFYTDEKLETIVRQLKTKYPDCAVTLSVGERSKESYERLRFAGADRYLLRHETGDPMHYASMHPQEMSWKHRVDCLYHLKELGYQVGCGFMVGSPGQTPETLAEDMLLISQLQPQMVGIGPFVPHHDTPYAGEIQGSVELTLFFLSILRLLLPNLLLPATTALGTLDPRGREKGILAGANVVMPNLSPVAVRKKYELYDHKICTGEEAAECRGCLQKRMESIGYRLVVDRGDFKEIAI